VRETRSPVSVKKIVVPPMGMATGFAMFLMPAFRVPFWLSGVGVTTRFHVEAAPMPSRAARHDR